MNLNSPKKVDNLLFKNAVVVDPEKETETKSDVLIEGGQLKQIGKANTANFKGKTIDLSGKILCPGLIDMHVHLREPGREDEETIETGCEAAMAGGFTSVCSMPNTDPPADNSEVVFFQINRAKNLLVDVFPIGAVTKGRAGEQLAEMADLVEAGAVAFSDDGDPVATSEMMRRALEYAKMFDVPIIDHCEDKTLSKDGAMHEGAVSTRLGLPGAPGTAEDVIVARDIQLAKFTGGKVHIAHISTENSVELVRRAKSDGIKVTCEVTPHHFTLNHEAVATYDTNAKMNPPLRSQNDVEAMIEGLKDGTIDVIATDHAPHSIEEKDVEFTAAPFGIVGLETALGLVLTQLVYKKKLTLLEAIKKMTVNPAKILNIDRGRFEIGAPASLTIFDPNVSWNVDRHGFKSKSKNSPFDNWQLRGEVFGLYNKNLWWCVEE